MRGIYIFFVKKQVGFWGLVLVLFTVGCSYQKETGFNRAMQNLTAHYNILYNANELLRQKQETYANTYADQYGDILNVYPDTIAQSGAADKELDAVIVKANTIINEKEQSRYVGDAYLVLGKANYLQGNFFNAVEFFSYVIRSYPKKYSITQEAAAWKVRALLYLNNTTEAKLTLDSAFINVDPKKKHPPVAVYAAALQYDINTRNYADGAEAAQKAITYADDSRQKLRWTFILGQLQELNSQNAEAIASYTRVAKSNASFEMAFNADLNRIRIQDMRNGVKVDRIALLLSLLKNENNADLKDQIYYQVAEVYATNKDVDNALKYYKLSVAASTRNRDQKGLSYLRIADIDFTHKADYIGAKQYYDSTLVNLSPNRRGYQAIKKKADNLQVLVDKLRIIAREDTLQSLAKMDEPTRLARMDEMVNARILQQQVAATKASNAAPAGLPVSNNVSTPTGKAATGSSFYFYNASAVSQGYTDFKRKWGDRKLEDNWRTGNKQATANAATVANNAAMVPASIDPDALPTDLRQNKTEVSIGSYRQDLLKDLPLTPELMARSNSRVYNAYLDIANFYRDILEDKKEAIANYELLLNKFPNAPNKAPIYYSLYRAYIGIDDARSAAYRDRLLKEYPQTVYAKVILDPDYVKKLDDNDARFNLAYNEVYDLYRQRKYTQAMSRTDSLVKQFPGNKMVSQLYYLRAISAGHLEKVAPFLADLKQIATAYPNDQLITPLVEQHINYVETNLTQLATQTYAIMNSDTTGLILSTPVENKKDAVFNRHRSYSQANVIDKPAVKPEPVIPKEKPAEAKPPVQAAVTEKPAEVKAADQPPVKEKAAEVKAADLPPVKKDTIAVVKPPVQVPVIDSPVVVKPPVVQAPVVTAPARVLSNLFTTRDSTNYYFVVNVSTGTTDLSSSRFGIGQFNRTSFSSTNIRHQLKNVGPDDQLIYVGRFYNLDAVKDYARKIIPLLPQIMKVPADKYSFFIITRENLDKLAAKNLLDDYIYYYQQTY